MRICFVSDGTLGEFEENHADVSADIVCFSFRGLGEVNYERELKGETSLFEDAALCSKTRQNVVVSGCYTVARGTRHKSAVVADRGRILGVSDMLNRVDGGSYSCGAYVKVYDTRAGKLGVVVAEDLYFPRVLETLSDCGADLILCIFESLTETLEQTLIRAAAFFYGVPVCLCAYGYAQAADPAGELAFASPESPAIFRPEREREYHLVETRRRGIAPRRRDGF